MNCTKKRFRLFYLLAIILLSNVVFAQDDILSQEVSIAFDNMTMKESLKKLEKETGISTSFNEKALDNSQITITFEKELLSEVLDALLVNENLSYKVIGNTVTIFRKEGQAIALPKKSKEKFTINGYFIDAESKETLIGASVYVSEIKKGTSSNEYGFYSLTLPEGDYEIVFSYIGYEPLVKQISLKQNMEFSPALAVGNELKEVIVTADDATQRHAESKMSANKISMDKLESLPVLMGERDVLKMVQLMPGVQSGSEGSTGLYVRGGGPDQNLILLDGVPIYNVNHLFGFLSTLNGDAIKSAEITKGGFPARYGGRLSSILDVRMKEGNMEKFHGDISLGLISGKFNLEGPIVKNKTSFNLSMRRTWLDMFTTPIQKSIKYDNGREQFTAYNFYDLNAKVNHIISKKSRLYLSSYFGNDKMRFNLREGDNKEEGRLTWGNRIISLRWNYQLSPKLFSNTTVYNTAYNFTFLDRLTTVSKNLVDEFNSKSNINDFGAKIDFDYLPNPTHHIRFGFSTVQHQFTPTVNTYTSTLGETPIVNKEGDTKINALESSAYIEDDFTIGDRIKINAGIHFANFNVENSNYFTFQPRGAFSYLINEKSSVKFSYSQMRQFLHLLTSPGLGLPTDLWVASTDRIKPEESTQYAVGFTRSLNNSFELTVEGYYKEMNNLLEYKSGFNIFSSSSNWQDKVLIGKGDSYGVELLLEKRKGKTTGWIGYTLSKSNRNFPGISQGETFPYKYDRRHDISLAVTHKKSDRFDFGIIWVYGSGNTYTLGTSNYNAIGAGDSFLENSIFSSFQEVNHVENRNNQRAPAYHRLDVSFNFHKIKKRGKRIWSFGLYNAYSRQNPFVIALAEKPGTGKLYLKQTSLLPVIPFASYSFKF